MPENDSNLFGGSVDRSKLEEMKAAAGDDPERQRQVAEVQAQVDAVNESDAAAERAREEALAQSETRDEQASQGLNAQQGEQASAADENAQATEGGEVPPGTVQPAEVAQSVEEPTKYASKGEWVEYAVSRGAPREDAEAATQKQLIEDYGSK